MGENSKIAWTDHTFNPWRGCTKVSPGCANCYAEKLSRRNPAVLGEWGLGKPRVLASAAAWKEPLKWNKTVICGDCGELHPRDVVQFDDDCGCRHRLPRGSTPFRRPRVFCASLADWLDHEVPIEWLARLLDTIRQTPNLDWLLLTKRPEHWASRLRAVDDAVCADQEGEFFESDADRNLVLWLRSWMTGNPPPNVWMGVSAEDQQRWDERVPALLRIPARVRFVSVEPMLEAIDMESGTYWSDGAGLVGDAFGAVAHRPAGRTEERTPGVNWVIFGGESGPGARPCNIDWIRSGVSQCREAGVAAFVKQVGANPVWDCGDCSVPMKPTLEIKDPKGGDPSEWSEDLRVRQFPKEV